MFNKKISAIAAFLLPLMLVTGCGMANQGENGRNNDNFRNVTYRDNRDANDRTPMDNVADRNNVRDVNDVNNVNDDNRDGNNMRVADDLADRITDMKEVKNATVIVTDNNAYVAVVLTGNKQSKVSESLKNKISDKVKAKDKSIDNVYVSANPDFVDRMTDYGRRIQKGEPIKGLFDEFGQMTRRVFPEQK
ncbi:MULTISPECIES: YhcN/YlaJ family sporulation lipoprotein [Bacillus]|uniref:YhcN/YlaJ family sporulation lipoprotein n=1 Tax=Bacillus TaxID=1386 RepID=UPI0015832BAD|nr:YhcN/YlaJ family sporulation lipoprotein [Bacillus glycinifermentans]MBU8788473.1 YhcN/YlaJ family sporulation lipoprotein [Bacillus glycinifermentans]NUJ17947.1 YhcN/YlaJ family sporulation lipoprotein [Bacillus glycinifermentans]